MFKLSEIAPAIQAELDAHEKAMAEHRETCREEYCDRCGRHRPHDPKALDKALLEMRRARPIATVPAAFADIALDTTWLAALVGAENIERAKTAWRAKRATLLGPPGAGKTSLAVAMFRWAIDMSPKDCGSFRYTSSHALAKARSTSALGEEAPLVDKALRSDLLLVDELGGEDPRHASAVAEVIYERHAENRPTWVTTGASPKAIADRYGGGIARRVFEGAEVFRLGKR